MKQFENILVFEHTTNTIRQMPQNYLIAHKSGDRWICEPDLAADINLATRVFKSLFVFDNKYSTGLNLLAQVTPNSEFINHLR